MGLEGWEHYPLGTQVGMRGVEALPVKDLGGGVEEWEYCPRRTPVGVRGVGALSTRDSGGRERGGSTAL